MPSYDKRCNECEYTFEYTGPADHSGPECPGCGSTDTKTVWLSFPHSERGKDPYDMLHGPIPSGKRIFSGPKVKSKTTV